jgi:glycosyltransferase involved in cell wall biosynthesis
VPRLSVCITTRNREAYIAETLESILSQCPPEVEVVVVDGASTDGTVAAVRGVADRYPQQLRLLTPAENSGLDADFDKAVLAAQGAYCWLFSDDDLLVPGAVQKLLDALHDEPTVVIVDASVHDATFERTYNDRRLPPATRAEYGPQEGEQLFRDCAAHLTFIGAVIVRRQFWLSRERPRYYGTEFIHVGVLFQAPIPGVVRVLREPLVKIRYGVGNWTSRAFDVWMYKWPALVWSFDWIDPGARRAVFALRPWKNPKFLVSYRATGQYGWAQFKQIVAPRATRRLDLLVPLAVAATPGWLAYWAVRLPMRLINPNAPIHQALDNSPHRWPVAA